MLIPSISLPGQHKIANAKVLIIGLGGLGSPAALYLAGAGIGKLGLLDNDQVEQSNLHRQIVHSETAVSQGLSKVDSALQSCQRLNSEIDVVPHEMLLDVSDSSNARRVLGVVSAYDMVLDCTDNPATRYLISDLCVLLGKVLVSGAAQKLEGQITVLNYHIPGSNERGPCYRCVFPIPPSPDMVKSCGEIGILGPVVGTIGTLMASEALRLIVRGFDEPRKSTMLMYNAWPSDPRSMFRTFGLRGRKQDCVCCGDPGTIAAKGLVMITKDNMLSGSLDYITFCGRTNPVRILEENQRISARAFVDTISTKTDQADMGIADPRRNWANPMVVDVREPHEAEIGPALNDSTAIPFSRFLRHDEVLTELQHTITKNKHDAVIFVCQQGNDSQVAAQKLMQSQKSDGYQGQEMTEHGAHHLESSIFIGDIRGGFSALDNLYQQS